MDISQLRGTQNHIVDHHALHVVRGGFELSKSEIADSFMMLVEKSPEFLDIRKLRIRSHKLQQQVPKECVVRCIKRQVRSSLAHDSLLLKKLMVGQNANVIGGLRNSGITRLVFHKTHR